MTVVQRNMRSNIKLKNKVERQDIYIQRRTKTLIDNLIFCWSWNHENHEAKKIYEKQNEMLDNNIDRGKNKMNQSEENYKKTKKKG